jgi:hypothetical protein
VIILQQVIFTEPGEMLKHFDCVSNLEMPIKSGIFLVQLMQFGDLLHLLKMHHLGGSRLKFLSQLKFLVPIISNI